MGLDIWFSEDIRNALLAADEASAATAGVIAALGEPCPHSLPRRVSVTCSVCGSRVVCVAQADVAVAILRAYREGYRAALTAVALAFGIAPQSVKVRTVYGQNAKGEGQSVPELGERLLPG